MITDWIGFYLVLSPSLIVQFSYFFSQFTEHQGHSLERKLFVTVLHNSVQYLPAYVKILIKSLKRDLIAHTHIMGTWTWLTSGNSFLSHHWPYRTEVWNSRCDMATTIITLLLLTLGFFVFEMRSYCWMNCNKLHLAVSMLCCC